MGIVSGLLLMKSPTESILLSVLANGLTALLSRLGRKEQAQIEKLAQGLREILVADADLQAILKRTIELNAYQVAGETFNSDDIRRFLLSPEVAAIVRQLYASEFAAATDDENLLRRDFDRAFKEFMSSRSAASEQVAKLLFETLDRACRRALEAAINRGVLSAHEAASALRHRVIKDELAAIKRKVSAFTSSGRAELQDILKFESDYRNAVQFRHGFVVPPHLDQARKVPIDDLYVPPTLLQAPRKRETPQHFNLDQFLSITYRSVLLGNPGGGKSTFASKLAHHLCAEYDRAPFGGRQVTPTIVILRDYGADKKQNKWSILQFIENTASATYQVAPPTGAFEYLLLSGRAMVIFDGLDELLETNYRREVSDDVESFCNRYPAVPVLVTSREVGYEQAPLDKSRFSIFRLSGFNEEQVAEYARKWFCDDQDLPKNQSLQMAEAFIGESQSVPDLRSNPLMLGLMCNIYRGESFIPRNRPAVYEKCALLLFERWDSRRRISVAFTFEDQLGPVMKFLAHWIYSDEGLQSGVTEEALVRKATGYLCEWRFEDKDQAERMAREFIEFCRGRAWVFTDTGTTPDGDKLYQFTHRTFLEYFTAAHLVRIHPTPEELGKILHPRIEKQEWDVVAQLAVQLQNKNVQGAGEALIQDFVRHGAAQSVPWTYLSFAARCLEFVLPKPEVVRQVTSTCLTKYLEWSAKMTPERYYHGVPLIGELLYAAKENRRVIAETLERVFVEEANNSSQKKAAYVYEVLFQLPSYTQFVRGERSPSAELWEYWRDVADRILELTAERMRRVAARDLAVCCEAVQRGAVTIAEVISWHGVAALFMGNRGPYRASSSVVEISLYDANLAVSGAYSSGRKRAIDISLANLCSLGHHLSSQRTPWVRSKKELGSTGDWSFSWQFRYLRNRVGTSESVALSGGAMFAVFGFYAVAFEARLAPRNLSFLLRWIRHNDHPCFEPLRVFFESRITGKLQRDDLESVSRSLGLSELQRSFLVGWSLGELTVVGRPKRLTIEEPQSAAEFDTDSALEAMPESAEEDSGLEDDAVGG